MVDKTIKIQTCGCPMEEIAIFCKAPHNIAMCNECYFDKQDIYGKTGLTMKKACLEQINQLEAIYKAIDQSVLSCSDMQTSIVN
jgi:hypothetical protein